MCFSTCVRVATIITLTTRYWVPYIEALLAGVQANVSHFYFYTNFCKFLALGICSSVHLSLFSTLHLCASAFLFLCTSALLSDSLCAARLSGLLFLYSGLSLLWSSGVVSASALHLSTFASATLVAYEFYTQGKVLI